MCEKKNAERAEVFNVMDGKTVWAKGTRIATVPDGLGDKLCSER